MKDTYTENELWALINKANNHAELDEVFRLVIKQEYLDDDVMDDMCDAIAFLSREMYR